MIRWIPAAALAVFTLGAPALYALASAKDAPSGRSTFPAGSIEGRVLNDSHTPVAGAMVSVVGRTTAAATTDRDGRYLLRDLPFGPYILSVHSRGYFKSRGRTVQLTTARVSIPEIQLQLASDRKMPVAIEAPVAEAPVVTAMQLAGFGVEASQPANASDAAAPAPAADEAADQGETAWRIRHLPRSILKDVATDAVWVAGSDQDARWFSRHSAAAMVPIAFFSDLPLSGQLNLMTMESFDRPGEIFAQDAPRSVAFVSVNTQAAGGAWSMQGAMTQGDLASWIVAGSYKSIDSTNHAYELGMAYSTQRYDGGNAAALGAIRESARNVGSIYGYDEWTVSPRLVLGYGTGYARYDYLGGNGVWSPRLSVTLPAEGFRVKALASRKALVPGAEEFAPSVTGMWLPPERTFSSLSYDGRFTPEQVRHLQISLERDLASGVTVSLRAFDQRVANQLIEIFDAVAGRAQAARGHYYVATAGDIEARGWGAAMTHDVPGYVRGTLEYTVTDAVWDSASDMSMARAVRSMPALSERVHDLQTSIEATIPQTATRVYAKYRMNTAFWSGQPDPSMRSGANGRFNVRVNQSLPFLRFSNADWEALVDIRNMFRDVEADSSMYDEVFAIRAPKRIVGGLQVRF
jgi:Carboxypeptidase regulatory-like domain/TonB dependent receptor